MPTSQFTQINQIISSAVALQPKSVLDIGVGFGKYGVLLREYLEFWREGSNYSRWDYRIDAIEAHEQYITPLHRFIYNNVYIGDASKILPTIECSYDLVLLIDVIEHFSKEDWLHLIDLCRTKAKNLLISTPATNTEQGAAFGNVYETHRSCWTAKDFRSLPFAQQVDVMNESLIFVIGEGAYKCELSTRQILARDWAFIYRLLRSLKKRFGVLGPSS